MSIFGGGGSGYSAPKLSALSVQAMGYGTPIQLCYGTARVSPTLGWTRDFKAIEHEQSGGKGFGGGGGSSFTYTASIMLFVCEGNIRGFGRVWRDKKQYTDITAAGFSFHRLGAYPQAAWGYLEINHPDEALAYNGTALLAASNYALSDSATLGNHSVETFGRELSLVEGNQNYLDAHIKDIVEDFLTNAHYGAISAQTYNLTLDIDHMHDYCVARGLLISPLLDSVRPAQEYLTEWAKVANAGIVWSEGQLKFRPFADLAYSNAFGDYTPDTTIRYTFDDADSNVVELIKPARKKPQDCYNQVTVNCLNRNKDYNKSTVTRDDQASIDFDGLRPAPAMELECIKLQGIAVIVAHTELLRGLYIRNTYEIQTWCDADRLEPVDFVTITSSGLGLTNFRCRILTLQDSQDGSLTITAEEAPIGVYCG